MHAHAILYNIIQLYTQAMSCVCNHLLRAWAVQAVSTKEYNYSSRAEDYIILYIYTVKD